MSNWLIAFYIGLFGSLHCVAMCGPLVLALPAGSSFWPGLVRKLVYQFGRIFTYALIGAIFGLLGSGFRLVGLQQLLGIISGLLLVLFAVIHFSGSQSTRLNAIQSRLVAPVIKLLSRLFNHRAGAFAAGMMHGLLPCGMVYMALAGSITSGNLLDGAAFMFFFGLGTIPLLLAVSMLPLLFTKVRLPRWAVPGLYLIVGIFLIIRSANASFMAPTEEAKKPHGVAVCR